MTNEINTNLTHFGSFIAMPKIIIGKIEIAHIVSAPVPSQLIEQHLNQQGKR